MSWTPKIEVVYINNKYQNQTGVIYPPANAFSNTSSCGDVSNKSSNEYLNLNWETDFWINITFTLTGDKYGISALSIRYSEIYFNNSLNPTTKKEVHAIGDILGSEIEKGRAYSCRSDISSDLEGGGKIYYGETRLQAFRNSTSTEIDATNVLCSADKTSDIVPIAVGCALAGLVVIVLIAYLIGRRRSRQKGYQSV